MTTLVRTVSSRISAHLHANAHPPGPVVCMYTHYAYTNTSLCKRPPPFFLARELQALMSAYSENTVHWILPFNQTCSNVNRLASCMSSPLLLSFFHSRNMTRATMPQATAITTNAPMTPPTTAPIASSTGRYC